MQYDVQSFSNIRSYRNNILQFDIIINVWIILPKKKKKRAVFIPSIPIPNQSCVSYKIAYVFNGFFWGGEVLNFRTVRNKAIIYTYVFSFTHYTITRYCSSRNNKCIIINIFSRKIVKLRMSYKCFNFFSLAVLKNKKTSLYFTYSVKYIISMFYSSKSPYAVSIITYYFLVYVMTKIASPK